MFNPRTLNEITLGSNINGLPKTKLQNLQRSLSWMTYPISKIDGLIGPNTRNAFAEYKFDIGDSNSEIITEKSNGFAINKIEKTQDILNADTTDEAKTKNAIKALCIEMGIGLETQIAYVLATTKWETNHTFQPVKEAYWKSEVWRKNNLHYYPYYGRGYVQLTWRRNYSLYSNVMREKLTSNPDIALDSKVALLVLVHGFKLGMFTGRKIEEYINKDKTDFKNARRCINGLDKWQEIQDIAEGYLN